MTKIDAYLRVQDMDRSKAFYNDLLNLRIVRDWNQMVIYENNLRVFEKNINESFSKSHQDNTLKNIVMLEVPEGKTLEDLHEYILSKNIPISREIESNGLYRNFRIKDPDNYDVEFFEPK